MLGVVEKHLSQRHAEEQSTCQVDLSSSAILLPSSCNNTVYWPRENEAWWWRWRQRRLKIDAFNNNVTEMCSSSPIICTNNENRKLHDMENNSGCKNGNNSGTDDRAVDGRIIDRISYGSLFEASCRLSLTLSSYLHSILNNSREENLSNSCTVNSQPVIAVSIPEGPYLPLAILAIHHLTSVSKAHCNQNDLSSDTSLRPILLPMDPSEGMARLKHIIADARPCIILYCQCGINNKGRNEAKASSIPEHNTDETRIKQAVQSLQGKKSKDKEVTEPLILNVVTLVEESFHQKLNNPNENLINQTELSEHMDADETNEKGNLKILLKQLSELSIHSANKVNNSLQNIQHSNTIHMHKRNKTPQPSTPSPPLSHIVYTSGTTGKPKGCKSSLKSLLHYLAAKNSSHSITSKSHVLLASALPFDPCLSDVLATFYSGAVLILVERCTLLSLPSSSLSLFDALRKMHVSHILCTPSLWNAATTAFEMDSRHHENSDRINIDNDANGNLILGEERRRKLALHFPHLEVIALGGEPIPDRIVSAWAAPNPESISGALLRNRKSVKLLATYGVTEACVYQTAGEVFWTSKKEKCKVEDNAGDGSGVCRGNNTNQSGARGQDVGMPLDGNNIQICKESLMNHDVNSQETGKHEVNHCSDQGSKLLSSPLTLRRHNLGLLDDTVEPGEIGEVLISGIQVDESSGYLNLPHLTNEKFISVKVPQGNERNGLVKGHENEYWYRTGDRGFFDATTGNLRILGRIEGEEGMVKIGGVRVEVGEVENAILDSNHGDYTAGDAYQDPSILNLWQTLPSLVLNCAVIAKSSGDNSIDKKLVAYCVLSNTCLKELGIDFPSLRKQMKEDCNLGKSDDSDNERRIRCAGRDDDNLGFGIICTPSPLQTLLRARCEERVRKGCTPSSFIILERMPLTGTGKTNRRALPSVENCITLDSIKGDQTPPKPLRLYGRCGLAVSSEIESCLNLERQSKDDVDFITTRSNFAMLGGDSLAATRVTRGLYAMHHGVHNSRTLGGSFGILNGPFDVVHLLRAETLQKYVDFLDVHGVLLSDKEKNEQNSMLSADKIHSDKSLSNHVNEMDRDRILHNAILEAIALDQTSIALAFLSEEIDLKFRENGHRLGKVKGRIAQKKSFQSNPLHLACLRGNSILVGQLLRRGCSCKTPDAGGMFPIHLACAGFGEGLGQRDFDSEQNSDINKRGETNINEINSAKKSTNAMNIMEEDLERTKCVRYLFEIGRLPLTMKNGSKQTVLHCAARGGYCNLLQYLMKLWKDDDSIREISLWGKSKFDWQDRWFRTPVHWAVLNGKKNALQVLLENGCSPDPPKPRSSVGNRSTSGAVESPLEICKRLYGTESCVGKEMSEMLLRIKNVESRG